VRRLVALAMPASETFVVELQRAWDDGDAVWPVDLRRSPAALRRLEEALRPAVVVDEHGERHRRQDGLPVEEGDAAVVATSGTSGEPKGVVLTHEALAASARATSERLGVDPAEDRWLACLPLAHVGGFALVVRALLTGTPVRLLAGFDAAAVAAEAGSCTLVSLVPTALGRLDPAIVARFRTVLLGGSAPPPVLPPNVVTTYGMTETGSGVVYDGLPLSGIEVRISSREEIWLRGPMLARAYRDGTDLRDGDGWLRTGDAGSLTADGRLTVHGRLDDLVVSGGENVWPQAVEAVLVRHPAVADAAVAGAPDPEWGERVVAYVVPSGTPPSLGELRALVREELGPWAAPRELVLVERLPRNAAGKLLRRELAVLDGTGEAEPGRERGVRASSGPAVRERQAPCHSPAP